MARERMGILELLCERGVDFLREALTVLVEGIMEVSCQRTCSSYVVLMLRGRSRQYVCKRDQAATFSGVGSTTIPSL